MCGINGFTFPDKKLAQAMNRAIKHRGPDDEGVFADDQVTLGHVRLSILDLSPAGHQPMFYRHGDRECAIVFNGEIYNFQEIRAELEKKGYTFTSQSDTEVILAAYLEYDTECLQKFNGMWAFVIYDPGKKLLFGSRDRLGVKPFYYYHKDGQLIFSSEIKGILAHQKLGLNRPENIEPDAVEYFFGVGFIPSPHTIFKDIYKLAPRESLLFDLEKRTLKTWEYYEIPEFRPERDKSRLLEEGKKLLEDAVRLRLIADVPVGAFLSGGLDSSAVVAIMSHYTNLKKLHTFSVGFWGRYDETPYIDTVKDHFGTQHHHTQFQESDFPLTLELYQKAFDEPLADFGFLPSFIVSREARKKVTVSLTGDGGDEIFAGYGSFANVLQYTAMRRIPTPLRRIAFATVNLVKKTSDWTPLGKARELLRWSLVDTVIPLKELYPQHGYLGPASRRWHEETTRRCLEKCHGNLSEASRYHSLFYLSMGDNFLTKTDRASMTFGLEARSPFCDWRWIEYASRIPTDWKINLQGGTKLLMREIIAGLLPERIIHRDKQGFTPPFYDYVRERAETIATEVRQSLPADLLPAGIREILDRADPADRRYLDSLMKGYLFSLWYQKWVCTE